MNGSIVKDDSGKPIAIVCGRTRAAQPCEFFTGKRQSFVRCNRPHQFLCDFRLEGPMQGKTCDRRMCSDPEHSTVVADNVHYCHLHARYAEEDRAEPPPARKKSTRPIPTEIQTREEILELFK